MTYRQMIEQAKQDNGHYTDMAEFPQPTPKRQQKPLSMDEVNYNNQLRRENRQLRARGEMIQMPSYVA